MFFIQYENISQKYAHMQTRDSSISIIAGYTQQDLNRFYVCLHTCFLIQYENTSQKYAYVYTHAHAVYHLHGAEGRPHLLSYKYTYVRTYKDTHTYNHVIMYTYTERHGNSSMIRAGTNHTQTPCLTCTRTYKYRYGTSSLRRREASIPVSVREPVTNMPPSPPQEVTPTVSISLTSRGASPQGAPTKKLSSVTKLTVRGRGRPGVAVSGHEYVKGEWENEAELIERDSSEAVLVENGGYSSRADAGNTASRESNTEDVKQAASVQGKLLGNMGTPQRSGSEEPCGEAIVDQVECMYVYRFLRVPLNVCCKMCIYVCSSVCVE
jgi:hypothetical protein